MIPVTKPFLPNLRKYMEYIEGIYSRGHLTNNGPLVKELTQKLESKLGVKNLLLVANGTLALQVAYRALGLKGVALTTPFTFIATASSLKWEGVSPRFVDIDPNTLNLSPKHIENAMAAEVSAAVPVHVYGNPCDVIAFEKVSKKFNVKVIYDAAHAFGVRIGSESVLTYGDASTLSFHATKIFQTVEGGAIVFKNSSDLEIARRMTNFGLCPNSGEVVGDGINAKMSEVHAAMGLAMLDNYDQIVERRCEIIDLYHKELGDYVESPKWHPEASKNGAYAPILLRSAEQRKIVLQALSKIDVVPRPYFSPALNQFKDYSQGGAMPNAESAGARALCLPLFYELGDGEVKKITDEIKSCLKGIV